jgi:hypothetical protein
MDGKFARTKSFVINPRGSARLLDVRGAEDASTRSMILSGQPLGLDGELARTNMFFYKWRGFTCTSVDSLE